MRINAPESKKAKINNKSLRLKEPKTKLKVEDKCQENWKTGCWKIKNQSYSTTLKIKYNSPILTMIFM